MQARGLNRALLVCTVLLPLVSCRTTTTVATTNDVQEAVYVPPPTVVFGEFGHLTPASFADMQWGAADRRSLDSVYGLDRYDTALANWGPAGSQLSVLEARTSRQDSVTGFVFDPDSGVVKTVVVRGLAAPPPQAEIAGFYPYLEGFPGKILILGHSVMDGATEVPYRYLFFVDLGVKIGLSQGLDELWHLDHLEYFDPAWAVEDLTGFKYGGELELIDTIGPLERR